MWISDFLKDLFKITPKCIDFFCETTQWLQIQAKPQNKEDYEYLKALVNLFIAENKTWKQEGLAKLQNEFTDCLGPLKKGCNIYPKTRFHNIEFRRFNVQAIINVKYNIYDLDFDINNVFSCPVLYFSPIKSIFPSMDEIENNIILDRFNELEKFVEKIPKYNDLFDALFDGNMEKMSNVFNDIYGQFPIFQSVRDIFFTHHALKYGSPYPKLHKQITALLPNIQDLIKRYFKEKYNSIINQIYKSVKQQFENKELWLDDITLKKGKMTNCIAGLVIMIGKLMLIPFDAYTIGRILKAIYNYNDSSLIITYAGGNHIKTYEDIFSKLNIIKTREIGSSAVSPSELKDQQIGKISLSEEHNACIQLKANFWSNSHWSSLLHRLQTEFLFSTPCNIKEGISFSNIA